MTSINTTEPKINIPRQATTPGYRHNITIPILRQDKEGNDLHLPMVILNGREKSDVESKAYLDTLKLFDGKAPKTDEPSNWDAQLEAQRAYWTIYHSVRVPGDLKTKWFLSKQQIEEEYNWDEADIMMQSYIKVVLTQPHLVSIDWENPLAFQATIDQIKKMGEDSDFFLNGLTTYSVNQFVKFLVAEREKLLTNNGSSGSQ